LKAQYSSGTGDIEPGNEMNGSPDVKRFTAAPEGIELRGFGMNAPGADDDGETDTNQNESKTDSEIRRRDSYVKGNSIQF